MNTLSKISGRIAFLLWDPRRRRHKTPKNLSEETTVENFTNLENEMNMQVQEAWRVPKKMNPKDTHQDML